jgi:hypothetical protein
MTTNAPNGPSLTALATALTLELPSPHTAGTAEHAQSLADGAAGTALLHIERAHTGTGTWRTAHRWLETATSDPILVSDQASLFSGAPAIAFILHAADHGRYDRYTAPRAALDRAVDALTHRRVDQADARVARAELPAFAEYDIISGLTGIGAHLLRHRPGSGTLGRILSYLVRLTEPLHIDGTTLPGWWTFHDPQVNSSPDFSGGHGNLGMAHGITGPLALLALAARRGVIVDGHLEAIETVCAWLDTWSQEDDTGLWWPQWITRPDLHDGHAQKPIRPRPSWCYGTPGVARAQQLAALATGDSNRRTDAQAALLSCLKDEHQLGRITDLGLCHGWAGLFQTTWRFFTDVQPASPLPALTEPLADHARRTAQAESGFLNGHAGLALAIHTAANATPPSSGWDTCLLIA